MPPYYHLAQNTFYQHYGAKVHIQNTTFNHVMPIVSSDIDMFPIQTCEGNSKSQRGYVNCEEKFDTAGHILHYLMTNVDSNFTMNKRTEDWESKGVLKFFS